jgi:hypothetical protein
VRSDPIAKAIVASKLARAEKIALLEEGITQKSPRHRYDALESLAEVDAVAFQKHLLGMLQGLRADLSTRQDGDNWFDGDVWKAEVVALVRKTNDAKCWAALTAATRRVSPKVRLYFLRIVGWPADPSEPDPGRRECLRYLLRFVDAEPASQDACDARDLATIQLARIFAIINVNYLPDDNKLVKSPRELSLLRERVREFANHELARPGK